MSRPARLCIVLSAAALALGAPVRATETVVELVDMHDGVGLSTAVTLPDVGTPPWPAVLVRSPYKDNFSDMLLLAANLGYVVVLQDTRGTGASEGDPDAFLSDYLDGPTTVDWIVEQPWCDGEVSMWGGSALGIPVYLMAPYAPEAMTCHAVAIATPDVFEHGVFHGGVFKQNDVETWTGRVEASVKLAELEDHRLCDEFWDPLRVVDQGHQIALPALHMGGWFDVFTQGTIAGYETYRQSEDPWAADRQYLVIGPWEHLGLGQAKAGQLTFPDGETHGIFEVAFPWLAFCHGGDDPGWPRVRYYTMGDTSNPEAPGNVWREADDWPLESEEIPLYVAEGGQLAWSGPGADVELVFPFDPADPSPTKGGRNLKGKAGPLDQAAVEARGDALVLSTEVLDVPVEVTGRVFASLLVTTPADDADVSVRLTDVYPDGRSMLVTEGIQRLSLREGCDHFVDVEPGAAHRVEVDLWSTSYIFDAGHRIRAVVTGSNHPRYELNPSIDGPVELALSSPVDDPSFLRLPRPVEDPGPEPEPDAGPEPQPEPGPELTAEPVAVAEPLFEPDAGFDAGPPPPDTNDATDDAVADVAPEAPTSSGGCAAGGSSPLPGLLLLASLLAVSARRRRTTRRPRAAA